MIYKSKAKINLYLDVTKKRYDGFHDIITLFHEIDYYDSIDIEISDKEYYTSNLNIPWESNLINKTIKLFKNITNYRDFNLKIKLIKKLPKGGGIGGGSSNAATILKFLGKYYNISNSDLKEIGSKLGSDIPFFIEGGTALAEGKGEILTKLEPLKLNVELNSPKIEIPTPEMYKEIDKNWNNLKRKGDPLKLYESLKTKNIEEIDKNLFNIFEQVVFKKYPKMKLIKNNFIKNNPLTMMSGSGSTFFKLKMQ
ncbi:4-diphosphocytidyl-2-C-methyl-D-erythritol kinase [Oceanotoga teriensis]|uniref:4-diphosphocytidyl-2-C-methyl-D-erythritol kinase n=1 Tax=Oceanotoga teriensis TaxID=515440 RepID=A0AA45C5H6_9BACT|nr:4-(cytidine 5'-diphospho)-2-C-methyl-D-erythritol kinase [Oceanotoga teriensis]PWJ88776.1 4-diphosphocytidyl-2-C-methyl-D-erythritol kinase [Oceanotoga teriensis]